MPLGPNQKLPEKPMRVSHNIVAKEKHAHHMVKINIFCFLFWFGVVMMQNKVCFIGLVDETTLSLIIGILQ